MERLPDEVGPAVERWVGPVYDVRDRSWPHHVTRVWRLVASGEVFWVKRHTQHRKFLQESRAYEQVVPALLSLGYRVPSLIAEDSVLRLFVLTDLPGHPAHEYPGEARLWETDLSVHRSAGQITRALHDLPLEGDDSVPMDEIIRARTERWIDEVRGVLDSEIESKVRAAVGDGSAFIGCQRVWCHRDWSPRNWIVDDACRVGMIDFENCAPDFAVQDLVKLCWDVWRRTPGAEAAFFEGYGRAPDAAERDRLHRLLWLHAISTIGWAVAHCDPSFERQGRALLEALRSGWRP